MFYIKWLIILLAIPFVKADNETTSTTVMNETKLESNANIFTETADNQTNYENSTFQDDDDQNVKTVVRRFLDININIPVPCWIDSRQAKCQNNNNPTYHTCACSYCNYCTKCYDRCDDETPGFDGPQCLRDDYCGNWYGKEFGCENMPGVSCLRNINRCRKPVPIYDNNWWVCPCESSCTKCYDRCDGRTSGFLAHGQCLRDDYCGDWYGKSFNCENLPGTTCITGISRCVYQNGTHHPHPEIVFNANGNFNAPNCDCMWNCTKCYDRCDGRNPGFVKYGQCLRDDYCGTWWGKTFDCSNMPGTICFENIRRCKKPFQVHTNWWICPIPCPSGCEKCYDRCDGITQGFINEAQCLRKDYCGGWYGVQFDCENMPGAHCRENINRCVY